MFQRPDFDGVQHRLSWLLVFCLMLVFVCAIFKDKLIFINGIDSKLFQNPIQETTRVREFTFSYQNKAYDVKPLAEYELWGLVVTHNNINSIVDIYHDRDSVDIKDLCVVWGDNLSNGIYKKAKFESGGFTCYYEGGKINPYFLSNNHLIAENPFVRKKIREVKVGDQIHFKGLLVGYAASGLPERFYRNSSLTREDEGRDACEVAFVEDLEIIKKGNLELHLGFKYGLLASLLLFLAKVFFFFLDIHYIKFKPNQRKQVKKYFQEVKLKPWERK